MAPLDLKKFLTKYPDPIQQMVYELRQLVVAVVPGCIEMVDAPAKVIGYGFGDGYRDLICTIIPGHTGVKLGIVGGADLPDPRQLLEGSGKRHRHIKFKNSKDVKRPGVKPLLRTAVSAWKRRAAAR